ncbi:hypothetical protein BJV77DRAFT_1026800 [Russula vinacea]|nr:hypothetical protein BJV77DRAFT_1026800 [Russula vinacea]
MVESGTWSGLTSHSQTYLRHSPSMHRDHGKDVVPRHSCLNMSRPRAMSQSFITIVVRQPSFYAFP